LSAESTIILLPRVPYLIEYLDPVAGTGYRHTVYPLFTAEETLLTRAEAYIMQKDYSAALSDMNLYLSNSCSKYKTLTEANISSWAASVADYDPKNPTPKKPLNPAFEIDQTQEGMIHTLLLLRRYETLHYGLRWFDVKRFRYRDLPPHPDQQRFGNQERGRYVGGPGQPPCRSAARRCARGRHDS